MKKGRPPRKDEFALWQKVAETAKPMHAQRKGNASIPPAAIEKSAPEPVIEGLPKRLGGPLRTNGHDLAPDVQTSLKASPLRMDKKAFGQLNRGRMEPEARLDLHGMTLEQAHPSLTRFIMKQHAAGKRLVLVITGKGKARDEGGPIPVRFGVLRHQVPQWLSMAPLAGLVLQVSQAHPKHGGGGAYYVYLKRSR